MDKYETAEMLAYLSAAYPNAKVSKQTAQVYHSVLVGFGQSHVMMACREIVRQSAWFPSASEILRTIARQNGVLSVPAAEAWENVLREVRRVGHAGHPALDATTTRVVDSIGWREVCLSGNQSVLRSNFLRMYEEVAREVDRQMLSEVAGSLPDASDSLGRYVTASEEENAPKALSAAAFAEALEADPEQAEAAD